MKGVFQKITQLFALWTLIGTAWAWFYPDHFIWFISPETTVFGARLLNVGLGLIMFGMGITLRLEDFQTVLKIPRAVLIGVMAQFLIMPLLGYSLAKVFMLETGLAVGLILVSCCPGGTASNVVTFLARGNLALSVLMTMCSSLIAIGLTPLLTGWLAGKYVEIDKAALFYGMVSIVLIPVAAGVICNRFLPRLVRYISPWSPVLSVLIIVMIVGGIIGAKKQQIVEHLGVLLLVVFLLHLGGFLLGYVIAKLAGLSVADRRTISIEVGMQNSGLGSGLASAESFASQFPTMAAAALAPVPSAISALYHCLIGSFLASVWSREHEKTDAREKLEHPSLGGIID